MAVDRFEQMKSLLGEAEQSGEQLRCTFHCPVSKERVESSAVLVRGEGLRDLVGEGVGLGGALREGFARAVTSAFGSRFLANRGARKGRGGAARFSEDEKNLAVFRSFQQVSSRFVWHGVERRFVAAHAMPELATEFSLQLCRSPVEEPYDEGVTARMMAEVATVDHRLADEERDLLERFVNQEIGTVEELLEKPALRKAELDAVSAGEVRETMLMMVWALAVIDERLHDNELVLLGRFADGLAIEATRSHQLKSFAAEFAVDRALELAYPSS
ncbi:MAG: hypothetical protein AAFQ82_26520, partial [Myxococcota bacterium]